MPRRGFIPKREVLPDPIHGTVTVTKLINQIMLDGKRGVAQQVCYEAFDIIKEQTKNDPVEVFKVAIQNVSPVLEVKPKRVGGATYQVPIEVRQERGTSIALRWIRDFAQNRKGKPMEEKLADEIIAAFKGEGSAIKKRDDTHKMAESNKAYAHFRW